MVSEEQKQPEQISLESLHRDNERLNAQFSLLLVEVRKLGVKVDKIDADQRKTAILLEETEGKFKLTLEGYMATSKKIESIDARLESIECRMDNIERRLDDCATKQDLEAFATKRDMMDGFERIIAILDKKVDRDEFDALKH